MNLSLNLFIDLLLPYTGYVFLINGYKILICMFVMLKCVINDLITKTLNCRQDSRRLIPT